MEIALAKLLKFAANVATAIRLNSAYSERTLQSNPNVHNDVMWLSDSLHNLGMLGEAIRNRSIKEIKCACDDLIAQYTSYTKEAPGQKSSPIETFGRYKDFIDVDYAISVFREIKGKANDI